jgi:heat shock protein HslJ
MRTILIVGALAVLVAAPVSAKAPRHLNHSAASLTENDAASDLSFKAGKVVGQDPDARIRFEMQRDNPFY